MTGECHLQCKIMRTAFKIYFPTVNYFYNNPMVSHDPNKRNVINTY